jgi:hypothetical protein
VADWLEQELLERRIKQEPGIFLASQFLDFLQARGMKMEQVGWELVPGVKSMRNLLALMESALQAEQVRFKRVTAWDWLGYNLEGMTDFF